MARNESGEDTNNTVGGVCINYRWYRLELVNGLAVARPISIGVNDDGLVLG